MGKNVLAIYPHPDDETFVSAGTLIKHVESGDMVTLVIATLGQMGRRMGNLFLRIAKHFQRLGNKSSMMPVM